MTNERGDRAGERVLLCGLSPTARALGRALRRAGARVWGQDPDPRFEAEAMASGSVDEIVPAGAPIDRSLTIALIWIPFADMPSALARLGASLPSTTIVADLSPLMLPSVPMMRSVPELAGRYVSSHPVLDELADDAERAAAGAEPEPENPFQNATVFVGAPLEPGTAAARVATLWRSIGARPEPIAPTLHDALVALTHQLPILSAAALTRAIRRTGSLTRTLAPGARTVLADATRAAAGSSAPSAEALRLSAPKLLPALEILEREVRRLRHALGEEGDELRSLLEEARTFRRELVA